MRTTVDLESDILAAAKEIARAENVGIGKVISRLVRQSLTQPRLPTEGGFEARSGSAAPGFEPFAATGKLVTNEAVDRLRDAEGV